MISALLALSLAGLSSVILMSAVNFAIDSDYEWLLLIAGLMWIARIAALLLNHWRRI